MRASELETRYLRATRRWFHAKEVELDELTTQDTSDLILIMRRDGGVCAFEQFEAAVVATSGAQAAEAERKPAEKLKPKVVNVPAVDVENPDKLAAHIGMSFQAPTKVVHADVDPDTQKPLLDDEGKPLMKVLGFVRPTDGKVMRTAEDAVAS